MVEMVAHDGCGFVEQLGDFRIGLFFEQFGQELDIIAPAGFDELLLDGGALWEKTRSVSILLPGFDVYVYAYARA